jgi:alkaline phosphatase D
MNSSQLRRASQFVSNRRSFLLSGASLAMLPALNRIAAGETQQQASFPKNPFSSGVSSGDPTATGIVLWTRLAPEPLEPLGGLNPVTYSVKWQLATDEAMQNIVQQGTALATPQLGHSVHVEVEGLKPDRWYWYRFTVGDAESPLGRTRTMPAPGSQPEQLRVAFASCQNYEQGLFTAYDHMAQQDLDMVLFLGDYIYEYAGANGRVRKHHGQELDSLDDYRARYAQYRTDEHLQAAHAAFPWVVVWDDHEFDNNCAGDISEHEGVDRDQYLLRRANAYQAYYESMPLRQRSLPRGPHMKIYRRVNFGRLAEFFMLDTRQYRTDQPNGDHLKPLTGEVLSPQGTLLGEQQEHWLQSGLVRSHSQWNILGQQVMMGRVDRIPGEKAGYSMDQWAGYDVARRRLLDFMATRRVPNPVVLTGDIHTNWVNDLQVDFDNENDPTVATEFVATSISASGNGVQQRKGHDELMAENPFVRFHNAERGYVSCTIDRNQWRSDFQVIDEVEKPGGTVSTRASFVVENGKAGAHSA